MGPLVRGRVVPPKHMLATPAGLGCVIVSGTSWLVRALYSWVPVERAAAEPLCTLAILDDISGGLSLQHSHNPGATGRLDS